MANTKRLKIFLIIVIVSLVGLSVTYLASNPGATRAPAPIKEVDIKQAEVVIDGFHFAKSDESDISWELKAKRAEVKKETGKAKLSELKAVYDGGDGTVITMTADEGEFDSETKAITLTRRDNDVTITTSSGYELAVKDLRWDDARKELSTDNSVSLTGEGIRMQGKGMVARADLGQLRVLDGVRTVFTNVR